MSSDEQLSARAAQGDARAFEAIFRRYHQDIYRFCLAMVGDADDAQDALQNTMVKVMRALPGESRRIQLRPWLYRIARNESIETLRKRRDDTQIESRQSTDPGPAESTEMRTRLRQLLSDLEQLPGRQRSVLTMRELAGLSYAEIGATLDCSEAVARQALYEARVSLRQMEAGREMRCEGVMRELSDSDGRVTKRREIQAHLRSCPDCRVFQREIHDRNRDLAALTPLPVAASAGLIESLLVKHAGAGAGAAAAGGNAAGALTVAGGKTIAASAVVKTAATVAAVAAIGIGAERGDLVHLGGSGAGSAGSARGEEPAPGEPRASGDAAASSGQAVRSQALGSSPPPESARGSRQQDDEQPNLPHGEQADANPAETLHSTSEQGVAPPGGGHGRAAAENRGRPDGLPDAAGGGQQTANANKPADAGMPESPGKAAPAGPPPQAKAPPIADDPPAPPPASPPATKPDAPSAGRRFVQPPPDPD